MPNITARRAAHCVRLKSSIDETRPLHPFIVDAIARIFFCGDEASRLGPGVTLDRSDKRSRAWQNDLKFGKLTGLRIDLYRPGMLLDDDVVTDGQAQPCPFTGRLGQQGGRRTIYYPEDRHLRQYADSGPTLISIQVWLDPASTDG